MKIFRIHLGDQNIKITCKMFKNYFCLLLICTFLNYSLCEQFPTQEFIDLLKPIVEKCEMMTTVDKELVQHFSEGKMPDDPKLKCYMKCMFLEFDVLDPATGTFHYEKMLELIPESMKKIAYNMGKNCVHFKGEDGDDLCQVSFDLHKCWQQSDPEHYFLM